MIISKRLEKRGSLAGIPLGLLRKDAILLHADPIRFRNLFEENAKFHGCYLQEKMIDYSRKGLIVKVKNNIFVLRCNSRRIKKNYPPIQKFSFSSHSTES